MLSTISHGLHHGVVVMEMDLVAEADFIHSRAPNNRYFHYQLLLFVRFFRKSVTAPLIFKVLVLSDQHFKSYMFIYYDIKQGKASNLHI